jgi:cytoskeletal protein CcmA (bactofilin family)
VDRHNITINGSGMTSGGSFHKVVIRGEGSVTGDVDCAEFICRGSSKAMGSVNTEQISIAGQSVFKGNVTSKLIKVYGQGEFEQNVEAKEMQIWGNAEINGHLKCEEANIRGRLNVLGDVEAESFIAKGGFKVAGLLNAGTIHIAIKNYMGSSEAKEIGGEKIIVKRKNSVLGLFNNKYNLLRAETIEGDDIYLEYTKAQMVRGTNVRIGPGCEIDVVEYKRDYHTSNDAQVKENRKV